jgi:transposase, IS30 family
MKHYSQLTLEKRYKMYLLLKTRQTQAKVAGIIGINKSTASRELNLNRGGQGYRPKQANAFAENRKQFKLRLRIDERPDAIEERNRIGDLKAVYHY